MYVFIHLYLHIIFVSAARIYAATTRHQSYLCSYDPTPIIFISLYVQYHVPKPSLSYHIIQHLDSADAKELQEAVSGLVLMKATPKQRKQRHWLLPRTRPKMQKRWKKIKASQSRFAVQRPAMKSTSLTTTNFGYRACKMEYWIPALFSCKCMVNISD